MTYTAVLFDLMTTEWYLCYPGAIGQQLLVKNGPILSYCVVLDFFASTKRIVVITSSVGHMTTLVV